MPTALWIANVHVTQETAYGEYASRASQALVAFGGEILVRGGKCEQLEGRARSRNVVVRFPSLQAAHDCYHSPAYQEALEFARGASERDIVIVEEIEA